jgi:hypothetical protein
MIGFAVGFIVAIVAIVFIGLYFLVDSDDARII